jgi:hypothetical protein
LWLATTVFECVTSNKVIHNLRCDGCGLESQPHALALNKSDRRNGCWPDSAD